MAKGNYVRFLSGDFFQGSEILVGGKTKTELDGVVDPATLHLIQVPDYRQQLDCSERGKAGRAGLRSAIAGGNLEPIILAAAGTLYKHQGGLILITHLVSVIDGLVRIQAAKEMLEDPAQYREPPLLRAKLYFDVDYETGRSWYLRIAELTGEVPRRATE